MALSISPSSWLQFYHSLRLRMCFEWLPTTGLHFLTSLNSVSSSTSFQETRMTTNQRTMKALLISQTFCWRSKQPRRKLWPGPIICWLINFARRLKLPRNCTSRTLRRHLQPWKPSCWRIVVSTTTTIQNKTRSSQTLQLVSAITTTSWAQMTSNKWSRSLSNWSSLITKNKLTSWIPSLFSTTTSKMHWIDSKTPIKSNLMNLKAWWLTFWRPTMKSTSTRTSWEQGTSCFRVDSS